jgi:ectoine hydroxylase-related dioxygenase (phytanoyl-CoA dioxygenase family)
MCGVWVALEDIHPDSGPLKYFHGSQKLPVFSNEDIKGGPPAYPGHIAETLEKAGHRAETARIRRGQAFIWRPI